MLSAGERLFQRLERRRIAVVTTDVRQHGGELVVRVLIEVRPVLLDAFERVLTERLRVPVRRREPDDREVVDTTAPNQLVQRGKQFLLREVAGGTEEDERITLHRSSPLVGNVARELGMPAKLLPHRRQDLADERPGSLRAEPLLQRRRQYVGGDAGFGRGDGRPTTFARVGDPAAEL